MCPELDQGVVGREHRHQLLCLSHSSNPPPATPQIRFEGALVSTGANSMTLCLFNCQTLDDVTMQGMDSPIDYARKDDALS